MTTTTANTARPRTPVVKNPTLPGRERLTRAKQPISPTQEMYGKLQRQFMWVLNYTYDRVEKFQKKDKAFVGIGNDIINLTNNCLILLHTTAGYNTKIDKEAIMREMSAKVKTIEDLVQIACHKRCITIQNRQAWLRKLTEIDDAVVGIAMYHQKVNEAKTRDGNQAATGKI